MPKRGQLPIALTIAGSDSGGYAGLQADLKTFAALRVHGASVVTALTAQNPQGVWGIQPATRALVRQQLEAVFAGVPPEACKTGMLYSAGIIRAIVPFFRGAQRPRLIVDPVMAATSGASLLKSSAVRVLCEELLPLATLVTPNLDEAQRLLGMRIQHEDHLRDAARRLVQKFGCAALVKGGHLRGRSEATDVFYDGRTELVLSRPFVRGVSTRGTGCTYSAAIAGACARGAALPAAVQQAKQFITQAIARGQNVAEHFVLNWGDSDLGAGA